MRGEDEKSRRKLGFEYLLKFFPEYDYHKPSASVKPETLKYVRNGVFNPDNIVGHQQRAFIIYWCLKGAEKGDIGVDMGCGGIVDPFCFGVDKYGRGEEDDYEGECRPHLVIRADKPLPFESDSFGFLVSHHSLEHMHDTVWTLREWIRIVKHNGILALVLPNARHTLEDLEHHAVEWTALKFRAEVLDPFVEEGLIEVVEFNTFKNLFSFNVVLRKK